MKKKSRNSVMLFKFSVLYSLEKLFFPHAAIYNSNIIILSRFLGLSESVELPVFKTMIIITSISNSSSRSRSSILLVFWYLVFNILFWDLFACCLWPGGQLHSSTLLVFIYISGVYREIQWATFCWKVHFLRDLKQNSSSIRSLLLPNVGM